MAATSVTGVGKGSAEHMTLGISHIIGPRMDNEKRKLVDSHNRLINLYAHLLEINKLLIEKYVLEK